MSRLTLRDPAFLAATAPAAGGGGIVTSGLIVHLDAGNSASYSGSGTTWTDLSGNGNNATLIGSPSFTASPGFFDITSDSTYVRLNKYSHGTNPLTYSLWVNFDTNKTWNTLLENGNWSDSLLIRAQFGLQLAIYAKGTEIGNRSWTPTTGVWYNVAYTRSGSTNTMYINGAQLGATFTDQTNMTFADQYMFLMRSQHTGDQYVDGKFAQFAIYNRGLSASEITQNFDALKTRYGY
jgi:hypothetical protein